MQSKVRLFYAIPMFFTIYIFSVRNPPMDLLPKIIRSSSVVPPNQNRCKLDETPFLHRLCTDFAPTLVRRISEGSSLSLPT